MERTNLKRTGKGLEVPRLEVKKKKRKEKLTEYMGETRIQPGVQKTIFRLHRTLTDSFPHAAIGNRK